MSPAWWRPACGLLAGLLACWVACWLLAGLLLLPPLQSICSAPCRASTAARPTGCSHCPPPLLALPPPLLRSRPLALLPRARCAVVAVPALPGLAAPRCAVHQPGLPHLLPPQKGGKGARRGARDTRALCRLVTRNAVQSRLVVAVPCGGRALAMCAAGTRRARAAR